MVKGRLFLRNGHDEVALMEISLPHRPYLGEKLEGKYEILSISHPIPIGSNISSGEPDMGLKIVVKEI